MPAATPDPIASFAGQGFLVVPRLVDPTACDEVLDRLADTAASRSGTRNLLASTWCAALADRIATDPSIAPLLPRAAVAVQCTYFRKTPARNWKVPLHQDLGIPVAVRVADPALGGWSEKEGSLYVQPPAGVLETLVAVRLHLEDCGPRDGALRVVPGSHRKGRYEPAVAAAERDERGEVTCEVPCGGALVMRPLLLHASSRSTSGRDRRVLHFVYGPPSLPFGLEWPTAT